MQSKWKWKDSVELTNGLQWLNETFVWSMFLALYSSVANNSHRWKPLVSGNVAALNEKHLGSSRHLKRTIKFMVLDHKRLDFFHFQTFPPNPFKVSKPGFPILEKNTLLRRSKSLRQNRRSNENGNTYNHLKSDTKHDNFNWLFSICYNSTLSREAWRQIETKLTESMLIYFSSSSLQLASRHAAGFFYAPCQRESNVNLISCSNLRSWLVLLAPIWYR